MAEAGVTALDSAIEVKETAEGDADAGFMADVVLLRVTILKRIAANFSGLEQTFFQRARSDP